MSDALQALQPLVQNPLPPRPGRGSWIAGLIGDHPSTYSRSPRIWNAAFHALDLDAIYYPFDVEAHDLERLLETIRQSRFVLGVNVTVPYKQAVIQFLDEIDARAERLDAVNTVVRTRDGRLVGSNTDGEGALGTLIRTWPGQPEPFMPSLERRNVLAIGAGGAGSAVAFALAEAIGPHGHLFVANRTPETALALGERIAAIHGNTRGLDEADAELLLPAIDLVVNCSTRGQAGASIGRGNTVTYLEPYSALAPAAPPMVERLDDESDIERHQRWFALAIPSIQENHALSMKLLTRLPRHAAFFDIVYAPAETMFLRQARWAGYRGLNGQGMIVFQAAAGLLDYLIAPLLGEDRHDADLRARVVTTMFEHWGR